MAATELELDAEELAFAAVGGPALRGWWLPASGPVRGTVVFCHGNSNNIASHVSGVRWLPAYGFNVLLFDYRGYGGSEGDASRRGTIADAIAAIDVALARDPERVVVYGHSLGGAIAINAAAERPAVRAVVAESTFPSYREVACAQVPILGVLLQFLVSDGDDPEDVLDKIPPRPLLVVHGNADRIVPLDLGESLFERACAPKSLYVAVGSGHRTPWVREGEAYAQRLVDFFTAAITSTAAVHIPFTLTEANNLSVHAILNGTVGLELMFHTGVDAVSLTKAAINRMPGLAMNDTVAVQSWGGTTQARHSTGNTLQLGSMVVRNLAITEDDNSGPGTDGKFGPDLFAGKVIEIDFERRELVLHASLPPLASTFHRLDLVRRNGCWFLGGELTIDGQSYAGEFMLHSGFGGAVLLDEQFVRERGLDHRLETLSEQSLTDSYGHVVKTRRVRLPSFACGGTTFSDVPAGIFDGALGSQRMSIVGGELLKRFHLFVDIQHDCLYLAPNQLANSAFGS